MRKKDGAVVGLKRVHLLPKPSTSCAKQSVVLSLNGFCNVSLSPLSPGFFIVLLVLDEF